MIPDKPPTGVPSKVILGNWYSPKKSRDISGKDRSLATAGGIVQAVQTVNKIRAKLNKRKKRSPKPFNSKQLLSAVSFLLLLLFNCLLLCHLCDIIYTVL